MILFVNVLLTDQRSHGGHTAGIYNRGLLPSYDKVDIFKYSMASFASINRWSRVYINYELDTVYKHRNKELLDYLSEIFQDYSCLINNRRYFYQEDWQGVVSEIMDLPDQYVWFFCNHDHVFIDSDLNYIDKCIDILDNHNSEYRSVYPTHMPEMMSFMTPPGEYNKQVGFGQFHHPCLDSVQLVSKDLLHFWWFSKVYSEGLGRTDYKEGVNPVEYPIMVPLYRELVRHFDGYHACGICPALTIPEGFFENDIKIRYGYLDRKPGWTQINPIYSNYRDIDPNGVDFKITPDRLPLFWRDRISDVDTNPKVNMEEHLIASRNAFITAAKSRKTVHTVTDDYFSEMP